MKKLAASLLFVSLFANAGCIVRARPGVYYAPRPATVVVQQQPMYVQPQPVVVQPQPVYVQQPTVQGTVYVR